MIDACVCWPVIKLPLSVLLHCVTNLFFAAVISQPIVIIIVISAAAASTSDCFTDITTYKSSIVSRTYVQVRSFLANVRYDAINRPSVVRLSSVTLVHLTQAVVIFSNISTAFGTLASH